MTPAGLGTAQARRNGAAAPAAQSPGGVVIPFPAAAHEQTEPFLDTTLTPGAGAVNVSPLPEVPPRGFMRYLVIEVVATGGALGAGVLSPDFPFNLFDTIQLEDVNGAPIFGPLDGFAALQANIWGAYVGRPDPRQLGTGLYDGTINTIYQLRVPVEIAHRDGFGSLANQNSAATYKLRMRLNPSTVLFSTAPTTVPAFRITARLEAWSLPDDHDQRGRPQEQLPPAHGTTQYWSGNQSAVAAGGNQRIPLLRTGNLIRAIVFINRTVAGARSDTVFPDPAVLSWDARDMRNDSQTYIARKMMENSVPSIVRDAGVFAYLFNASDHNTVGDDAPTFWWPTSQSSRIEVRGNVAAAGNAQTITNDVAPVEVIASERYVEDSRTGGVPTR